MNVSGANSLLVITIFMVFASICVAEETTNTTFAWMLPCAELMNESAQNSTLVSTNDSFSFSANGVNGSMRIGDINYSGVFSEISFYSDDSGNIVAEGVFALEKQLSESDMGKPSFDVCGTEINPGYSLSLDDGNKVFFCGYFGSGGEIV